MDEYLNKKVNKLNLISTECITLLRQWEVIFTESVIFICGTEKELPKIVLKKAELQM